MLDPVNEYMRIRHLLGVLLFCCSWLYSLPELLSVDRGAAFPLIHPQQWREGDGIIDFLISEPGEKPQMKTMRSSDLAPPLYLAFELSSPDWGKAIQQQRHYLLNFLHSPNGLDQSSPLYF